MAEVPRLCRSKWIHEGWREGVVGVPGILMILWTSGNLLPAEFLYVFYIDADIMPALTATKLIPEAKELLRINVYIVISTLIIFYIDILTPLGLMVWILYFIPLFLTLHSRWKYGPYLGAGVFILLIAISFFLSPRDISEVFAIINRVFFSAMLIVTAFLISRHKQNIENLQISERRYRYIAEWSPDAIIVQHEGKIVYTNPAGRHLFATSKNEDLVGKDIINLIFPNERDIMRQRINQVLHGARMEISKTRLKRCDGTDMLVEVSLGEIILGGKSAVQIILRAFTNRDQIPEGVS